MYHIGFIVYTLSILCSMEAEGVSGMANDYETVDMSAVVTSAPAASSPRAEVAADESHPAVTHGK